MCYMYWFLCQSMYAKIKYLLFSVCVKLQALLTYIYGKLTEISGRAQPSLNLKKSFNKVINPEECGRRYVNL